LRTSQLLKQAEDKQDEAETYGQVFFKYFEKTTFLRILLLFSIAQELMIKKQGLEEVMETLKQGSSAASKQASSI